MTRVTLVTEIPAPYRIPLFNALAERVQLRVVFLRDRNPERAYELHEEEWRFERRTLPGADVTVGRRWVVLNRGLLRSLRGSDAIVVGGWNQPAFWLALAWCSVTRTPCLLWVESTAADHRGGRLEAAKRRILRGVDRFLVPGDASRDYLRKLGVGDEKIAVAPNAVDAAIFAGGRRTRENGACRLVGVGRLSPDKGFDVLLEAARDLDVEVVLAGAGPEEPRLRAAAGPNVTFLGNVARDELPDVYANADVAVVPSRSDPWNMVLNEAALAGLPLVTTSAAGGAYELVEHGANGFVVPPDDVDALRDALRPLIEDGELRRSAGARSREIAARFTPEAWADALAGALSSAAAQRRSRR